MTINIHVALYFLSRRQTVAVASVQAEAETKDVEDVAEDVASLAVADPVTPTQTQSRKRRKTKEDDSASPEILPNTLITL